MPNMSPRPRFRQTRRLSPRVAAVGCAILSLAVSGCSTIDVLNLRHLGRPPVRVGVARYDRKPALLFFPQWSLLNDDLELYLNEPVAFQLMKPWQIAVHLGTGRLQFAMLSPGDYSAVADEMNHEILAVPVDQQGRTSRVGLIVVAADSPIHSLSELKGRRFHFLPGGNVLNEAVLGCLLEAGVVATDLDKGILGLELDTHHISSAEVVKSVVLERNSAGVIEEADYEKWAESGGIVLLPIPLPAQDQVRIIGRTVRVPNGPFVVSNNTPPELKEKVREYLLKGVTKRVLQSRFVLGPMGYKGFADPIDPSEYEAFFEVYRKLHPPEPPEPSGTDDAGAESTGAADRP